MIGVEETIIRTVLFLALLALGGYFYILIHRRGTFKASSVAKKVSDSGIKLLSTKYLGARKYLAVVEHLDRRFLIAVTADKIEKISSWDRPQSGNISSNFVDETDR